MKAAQIGVGDAFAYTEGSGKFDQRPGSVTKVLVTKEPEKGYVYVRLLEAAKSSFGVYAYSRRPRPKEGDVVRVETRQIWMPWPDYETRLKKLAEDTAQSDKEQRRRDKRLARINERLDNIVPVMGPKDDRVEYEGRWEAAIRINTDRLERLLAAAEQD